MTYAEGAAVAAERVPGLRPADPLGHVRVLLGGARVDLVSKRRVLDTVRSRWLVADGAPLCLASANVDHIRHFGSGSELQAELDDGPGAAWLVLLDGKPLQWQATRLVGRPWEMLAGSVLLPELLALAGRDGVRVGVLGGTPEMHAALRRVLAGHPFHGLVLAGLWAPSRADLTDRSAELAAQVRSAGVELLIVALGKPRQEQWLRGHAAAAGIRVGLAFGAAPDFLAGSARRAPAWVQHRGLEWAWRLAHEPRRLARRYLVHGPVDIVKLITQSQADGPVGPAWRRADDCRAHGRDQDAKGN